MSRISYSVLFSLLFSLLSLIFFVSLFLPVFYALFLFLSLFLSFSTDSGFTFSLFCGYNIIEKTCLQWFSSAAPRQKPSAYRKNGEGNERLLTKYHILSGSVV